MSPSPKKVVIGTWPLSGDLGPVELTAVSRALDACVAHGFTEFDTAPNYGKGFVEHCLGRLQPSQELLVHTKCGSLPFGGKDFSVEALEHSVEQSRARLGEARIGALYLHNPRGEQLQPGPHLEFLRRLQASEAIRFSGISVAKGSDYGGDLIAQFDHVQDDANLLHLAALRSGHRPRRCFVARSPLATGILAGKMTTDTVFHPSDYRAGWLVGDRLRSILERVGAIRALTDLPLRSVAQRFLLHCPGIDQVVFGVKSAAHVEDLADDVDAGPLDAALAAALTELEANDFNLEAQRHLAY